VAATAPPSAAAAPARTASSGGGDLFSSLSVAGNGAAAARPTFAASPVGVGGGDLFDLAAPLKPAVALPFNALEMDTNAFGSNWKQSRQESRLAVQPSSCDSPKTYVDAVKGRVGLHHVQTIKEEVICSGKHARTGATVFVHAKVRQGRVDLIVRSQDAQVNEEMSALLRKVLA
jgi:hypothetical protein